MKSNLEMKIEDKQKEIDNVLELWAVDAKKVGEKPNFDEYSRKAEKLYEKVSKKYVRLLYELQNELDLLIEEQNKTTI